ncbi:MAG: iron ABC transporter substrate-binding protein [Solirubrobacterales bacterium]|nr:iron ABC transporter substrate-binding protein [Solirubrobacterales bacterium]
MSRLVLALPALAAALTLASCGGDDTDKLTVYSGREEELVAPLFDRFQEETGTELDVRYGDTAELAATIQEEGDNSPADVFFGQDAGALGALEKEGLLSQLPDEQLQRVDARFRSADGRWTGSSGRARVVAYNTENAPLATLPESILDFTAPEWKGRIGWAPTNGSFQAFVTAMRLTEGEEAAEEWLRGVAANDPVVFEDNEAIRDSVASGEVDVGFINHYYVAQAREEEGDSYPVEAYHPPGGDVGSLINVAGAGILESSGNSEQAEELIAFLLSDESQRFFSEETKEYPLVEGIPSDPAVTPLDEIQQPDVSLGELDDLEGTLEMLQRSGAL